MNKPVVDFVIAGKPKSGTSALAYFLSQHPQICFSRPKEPNYFCTDLIEESDNFHGKKKYFPIRSETDYARCFSHKKAGQICGEATPRYLSSKEAAKNIYAHNPNAKIIIMLRHPVDFMHSGHTQLINAMVETEKDFAKALQLEEERAKGSYVPKTATYPSLLLYSESAKYFEQVRRFVKIFPEDNVLVLTHEEFKESNEAAFKKVLNFLNVDESFIPEFEIVNASKAPRSKLLNGIFNAAGLRKLTYRLFGPQFYARVSNAGRSLLLKDQKRNPMSVELKAELEKKMLNDVHRLSKLLERDFVKEWNMQKKS